MRVLVKLKQRRRADGKPWASLSVLFSSPLALEAWVSGVCSLSYSEHNCMGTHTYDPSIWEDETGGWPGVQGHPSYSSSSSPTWVTKWDPCPPPPPKKEALSMQNSLCIQSVHCDPDAFLPRWLHTAHCLTLPTLKYELGSIPCRHKQICSIPFKSYVVLDYMMQLKLKMSSTDENLTLILPLNF